MTNGWAETTPDQGLRRKSVTGFIVGHSQGFLGLGAKFYPFQQITSLVHGKQLLACYHLRGRLKGWPWGAR